MINSKRLAALCGVFFLTSVVTAVAVSPYTDISDKTDKAAVDYVYDIQGLTFAQGTEFHPLQPVSRQEFADMLYRLTPSSDRNEDGRRRLSRLGSEQDYAKRKCRGGFDTRGIRSCY